MFEVKESNVKTKFSQTKTQPQNKKTIQVQFHLFQSILPILPSMLCLFLS